MRAAEKMCAHEQAEVQRLGQQLAQKAGRPSELAAAQRRVNELSGKLQAALAERDSLAATISAIDLVRGTALSSPIALSASPPKKNNGWEWAEQQGRDSAAAAKAVHAAESAVKSAVAAVTGGGVAGGFSPETSVSIASATVFPSRVTPTTSVQRRIGRF